MKINKDNNPKHLSPLAIVNFYRTLFKRGKITHNSQGYKRMKQLEYKLECLRTVPSGRRVQIKDMEV